MYETSVHLQPPDHLEASLLHPDSKGVFRVEGNAIFGYGGGKHFVRKKDPFRQKEGPVRRALLRAKTITSEKQRPTPERKLGRHKCDNADLRKHIQLWDLELNNHRSRRSIIRTSRGKHYESIKKKF